MVSRSDRDSEDKPVPRDLPDQQADAESEVPDPLSVTPAEDGADDDVPETDEAGTGRRGQEEHTSTSEHPEPQEPAG